jgi:hypothetical protein
VLAVAWLLFAVAVLVLWGPLWKPLTLLAVLSGGFVWWWLSQRPSNDRDWDPDFEQTASVSIAGDLVEIRGFRNTDYSATGARTTRFETRELRFSELCGVDMLVTTWGSKLMSHPMFVFDFGPDGRVCMSIEVRYRRGQQFSILRSLYRQQELMYVVADERDAILRRTTNPRRHDVYLYRLDADGLSMRQFFLEYATSINELAAAPRWYHGLLTNCTMTIYRRGRSHMKWDRRMLINGSLDQLLYERAWLDQSLPFEELKRLSLVNEIANAAPAEGFSDFIRRELPGYRLPQSTSAREPTLARSHST